MSDSVVNQENPELLLATIAIRSKIESLIIKGEYNGLLDFIATNPDLATFEQNNQFCDMITRTCRFRLDEDSYQHIMASLKAELEASMRIESERIETVKDANGKEIVKYHGDDGTVIIDNSYSDTPLEDQLSDTQLIAMQDKYRGLQPPTTEELMAGMMGTKKIEIEATDITTLNVGALSGSEQELATVAKAVHEQGDNVVQVDFENNNLIVGDSAQVVTVQKDDEGALALHTAEQIGTNTEDIAEKEKAKTKVKTMDQPRLLDEAGISTAIIMALLTGLFIGLIFLNLFG